MSLRCIATVTVLALVTATAIGCQSRSPEVASGPAATPTTGTAVPPGVPPTSRAAKGPHMGTAQQAGPFEVILMTDPAIRAPGDARFAAVVTKGGRPVTDANVTLGLSMAEHGGPSVALQPADGRYEGKAPLSMAGDWDAKVTVKAGGSTGTAGYVLWANP